MQEPDFSTLAREVEAFSPEAQSLHTHAPKAAEAKSGRRSEADQIKLFLLPSSPPAAGKWDFSPLAPSQPQRAFLSPAQFMFFYPDRWKEKKESPSPHTKEPLILKREGKRATFASFSSSLLS